MQDYTSYLPVAFLAEKEHVPTNDNGIHKFPANPELPSPKSSLAKAKSGKDQL